MQTSHECSVNSLAKQWLLVFSGSDYRGIRTEEAHVRRAAIRPYKLCCREQCNVLSCWSQFRSSSRWRYFVSVFSRYRLRQWNSLSGWMINLHFLCQIERCPQFVSRIAVSWGANSWEDPQSKTVESWFVLMGAVFVDYSYQRICLFYQTICSCKVTISSAFWKTSVSSL